MHLFSVNNKQGDNIQSWYTPFPSLIKSVVSCTVLSGAPWPAYRFLRMQVGWSGIPINWRFFHFVVIHTGFLSSSAGKESLCNAGDPGSIPWLGRSTGEGIGYPLLYSWASLVAQLVKNPPAMQETWVRSLGWEDPLEKGKATHSSMLVWRIPWTVQFTGSQRVGHNWATLAFT